MEKHIAIVLAGGNGSRMKSSVPKQYMLINEKPVIYYSLKMFEDSFVDSIILVCKEGEEKYCKEEIVDRFGLKKVVAIIAGGKERYDSVYNGLLSIKRNLKNITCRNRSFWMIEAILSLDFIRRQNLLMKTWNRVRILIIYFCSAEPQEPEKKYVSI